MAAAKLSDIDEQSGRYRMLANKVEAAAANFVTHPSVENLKELNALFARGQRMLDMPVHIAYSAPGVPTIEVNLPIKPEGT